MDNSLRHSVQRATTIATAAIWALLVGSPALADDTEIFFGQSNNNPDNNPNVLLIIDTSGSMDESVDGDSRDRLKVVQDTASDIIDNLKDVNVGVMRFDFDKDRSSVAEYRTQGGMIVHEIADVESHADDLKAEINRMHHDGGTPLSETYHEAMSYFMGGEVLMGKYSHEYYVEDGDIEGRSRQSVSSSRVAGNQDFYKSPITGACQRNYIIYLSDGKPTRDKQGTGFTNAILGNPAWDGHESTSCANDHGDTDGMCVDEIAEFLYENDFSDEPGQQNVISHFIGFALDLPIFEDAAVAGGGEYYRADNADQLRRKLVQILREVAETDDGFTAPAVTVNAFDRTSHLDQLYFTVFKPTSTDRWAGNLKKYKFVPKSGGDGLVITDKNGNAAVDENTGFFFSGKNPDGSDNPNLPKAHSYWSPTADGASVQEGGAASHISLANRSVFTNSPGSLQLESLTSSSSFASRMEVLHEGFPQHNAPEYSVDEWIEWAAGVDVKDSDKDDDTTDARQQIGAPLHSKPSVVVYGGNASSPNVKLFVGTNDGFLHAIDGETGQELWAFMPHDVRDIVPRLVEDQQTTNEIPYGVDGHVSIYKNKDTNEVTLIFGLRRGGNAFYAMDVTDPYSPSLKWRKTFEGQSWSRPVVQTINAGTDLNPEPKNVVLIGGGYDRAQDANTGHKGGNTKGNSIHMLDLDTGNVRWSASSNANNAGHVTTLRIDDMKDSIPSAIRGIDLDLDGFMDRMYANDVNGRLFRFDLHTDQENRISGGMIASLGGAAQGGKANNRRFYYAPDIALGSQDGTQFLTLTMASGFRAHPLTSAHDDYLFGVRDFNTFNRLGTDTMTAVSDYEYDIGIEDLVDVPATSGTLNAGSKGFKRALTSGGEKALAPSRIFQNKAFYTTYKPGSAPASNPCAPAVGSGKLVIIDLKTGDVSEDFLQKPGIPPEVTFLFGEPDIGDTDICFGSHCETDPDDPTGPVTPPHEGSDDDDMFSTERDVQCLAGPESCTADGVEVPQRTFWRQDNTE